MKTHCFGILFVWFRVVLHLFVLRSYRNVSCFIWYFCWVSFFVLRLTFLWLSLLKVFYVLLGYKDVLLCFQCVFVNLFAMNEFFAKLCFERMVFSLKGSVMEGSVIKDCFAELFPRQNGCFLERCLLLIMKFFR